MASIRKHGGAWQARVRRKGYPETARSFTSRKDAERWARDTEAEMDRGAFISRTVAESTTLHDVLERYLDEVSPTLRGHDANKYRLRALQRQRIAQYSMASLTPEIIANWRNELAARIAPATVVRELATLGAIINHARREWAMHIPNPVELVRKPAVPPGRCRVLSPEEEARLLDAAAPRGRRSPWLQPAIILSVETAMRRGELLALTWANINLERRTAFLPMTKNGSARAVPLSSRAIATLAGMPRSPDGRVIPMSATALALRFSQLRERVGLADFRWHDLRHTAATRIARRLPNIIELSSVTGHRNLSMLKRYVHPEAEELAYKLG
ncbi:site-specific integrase [Paraburkholderia bonniea]|uniref:tyrosine-type recombinase/integrase n=1 Tax=Paraburkholderia bonniea TaxID=2152891 RepID=UPI002572AB0B|nr:site-specific integrase [Paraburkholderia bonniea]WJF89734.1 site-specific integrase [Paraburkholderia bonniea]WJF93048.1 site-specific integrase [Paraburkholderia bonniea]